MSQRIYLLVEGQSEESFVKQVLAPHFFNRTTFCFPIVHATKRVKCGGKFRGGVTNFAKFENDLCSVLRGAGAALVTTIVDYYALPADFPGMHNRPQGNNSLKKVRHVEAALQQHFSDDRFLPFLALHEFEAWLFSDIDVLPRRMTTPDSAAAFAEIRARFESPEDINDHPETAPSKRILSLFPAYKKKAFGPGILQEIGLPRIRKECPHFDEWLSQLEKFAVS